MTAKVRVVTTVDPQDFEKLTDLAKGTGNSLAAVVKTIIHIGLKNGTAPLVILPADAAAPSDGKQAKES